MDERAYRLRHEPVRIARSALPAPVVSYDVLAREWQLEVAYGYLDPPHLLTVPQGFRFDLASVPRPFWWLIAPFELSVAAPLVHDFLYRFAGDPPAGAIVPPRRYDRTESDALFRRIMAQEGVPAWRRAAAWRAVRWFGGRAWGGRGR